MTKVLSLFSSRLGTWSLASTSFACLLGHFYNFWSMRFFACTVLPLATGLLIYIAYASRRQPLSGQNPCIWIVEGALGGVFAAVIYDLFRLPFVLYGYPLFGVFPKFGQLLLGAAPTDMSLAVQTTGWIYHFSNGAALGIMFLAMLTRVTTRTLFWGAVVWACAVEILLLLTPYYGFFKLDLPFNVFIVLTLSAHLVFGIALGLWCQRRLRPVLAVTAS